MILRRLQISNFRGIESLDWKLAADQRLICLVGAGDSNKTNILDAIALGLGGPRGLVLTDADFYECDPENPISVELTVGEVPPGLLTEQKYGYWMRGISPEGELHDEPESDDDVVLTVRFQADSSLEPTWTLYKEALEGSERRFGALDRERLGPLRTDERAEFHLRWSRGSALMRLVEGGDDTATALSEAKRGARSAAFDSSPEAFRKSAATAAELIAGSSGATFTNARPGIDPSARSWIGGFVLHDGAIPALRLGLGSRRLASLALQMASANQESIVLIDELELGLEPHRLSHLLASLRARTSTGQGQVIVTSHSPVVVESLDASQLRVVLKQPDRVALNRVPSRLAHLTRGDFQAAIRLAPSALLARRVIVGEGKTEVGLLRALAAHWAESESRTFAASGTAIALGRGTESVSTAGAFMELGIESALVADDDLTAENRDSFEHELAEMKQRGLTVIRCSAGRAIEQEVVEALEDGALTGFVATALAAAPDELTEQSVVDSVNSRLDGASISGLDPVEWADQASVPLDAVRAALAKAAAEKKWFKSESKGAHLGEWLAAMKSELRADSILVEMVKAIKAFALNDSVSGAIPD